MSAKGCISGEIEGLHSEANILWNIPNYFSSQKADFFYESPPFHFLRSTWNLRIYPNGVRTNQSVGYVGLYIKREELSGKPSVYFKIGIVRSSGLIDEECGYYLENQSVYIGWSKYVERRIMLINKHLIAPEGTLTVRFIGKAFCHEADAGSQTKISDGTTALSRDFQTLLSTERSSDVAIKVKTRLFRAHKLILGARSTVFSAMFEHDMKAKNTSFVDIMDCEPATFQEFLLFIYTGKIDNLSSENVFDIFSLANKYDLSDLKRICIDFMEENLCLNTVCNVLSVADTFNEVSLKDSARGLLVENLKTVMSTESWVYFIRENPKLATEILMTAIPKDGSRKFKRKLK